jgi:hypothetical protein
MLGAHKRLVVARSNAGGESATKRNTTVDHAAATRTVSELGDRARRAIWLIPRHYVRVYQAGAEIDLGEGTDR